MKTARPEPDRKLIAQLLPCFVVTCREASNQVCKLMAKVFDQILFVLPRANCNCGGRPAEVTHTISGAARNAYDLSDEIKRERNLAVHLPKHLDHLCREV